MLQKIQCVFDRNFLATCFIIIIWSLKICIIRILVTYLSDKAKNANYLQENSESTKLRALRAHMLMCQRALRAYVL